MSFIIISILICSLSVGNVLSYLPFADTNECASMKVPFDINNWMFALPKYAPSSLITAERIKDPMNHYENVEEHVKLMEFFLEDCKKYQTEAKEEYFSKYVVHYPLMVAKFYCALVGEDRALSNFTDIGAQDFYVYLNSHVDQDWDWLTPSNVKRPATWSKIGKELVIQVVTDDSKNRGLVSASWDPLYSNFADLLFLLATDFQRGDFSTRSAIRFPVDLLPVNFIREKFHNPLNEESIILSPNDLLHITEGASRTVSRRIQGFLDSLVKQKSLRISSPILLPGDYGVTQV